MALLSMLSRNVRGAVYGVLDWSLITPVKNMTRPLVYVGQYTTCVLLLSAIGYGGWTMYSNPAAIFETITNLSPIEIKFKEAPAATEAEETTEVAAE